MAKKGVGIIASKLGRMVGVPDDAPFLQEFSELFEGPVHFEANEPLWNVGDKEGYLWFVHFGYGFDRILLEDGSKMLVGMTEPGILACDEYSLIHGGASRTDCIMYTPGTAYRLSHRVWREFVMNNDQMCELVQTVNAYFLQMRKQRLLRMKLMDKVAYWKYIQDRFPGIEKYCSQTEIAKYFGVSKSTMHRIMKSA